MSWITKSLASWASNWRWRSRVSLPLEPAPGGSLG